MMKLPKQALDILNIHNIKILKEFYSKNNKVYLASSIDKNNVSKNIIVKEYINGSLQIEKEMLLQLKSQGVLVPFIYGYYDNLIFLEYIHGQLLIDKLSTMEYKYGEGLLEIKDINLLIMSLADWFEGFYYALGNNYIRGDINLRNFIIRENKIYGIDFDRHYEGIIEKDIGRMCAFILTYNPPFTFFKVYMSKRMINLFNKRLNLNETKIRLWIYEELNAIEKRRGIEISKNILYKLKQEGLIEK